MPDDPSSADIEVRRVPPPAERIEEASKGRRFISDEIVRGFLAVFFTLIFLLTIVLSFLHLSTKDWGQTKEWLQVLLPAETALIGSATGFYFGARKSGS